MADIKFTGSADFSNVEKAYAKLEADTKRLEDQSVKLARAAESGGTSQQRAAERAVDAAGKARASVDQLGESLGKTGGAGAKSGDEIKKAYDGATRDVAKLETANHRLAKSVEASGEKADKLSSSFSLVGKASSSVVSDVVSLGTSLLGSVASVGALVEAFRAARDEAKAMREEANRAQLDAAGAQGVMSANFTPNDKDPRSAVEQFREFSDELDRNVKEAGFKDSKAARLAASDALSAVGKPKTANAIVKVGMPLLKSQPENLPNFAGAVGDLANASELESEDDIRKLYGLIFSTQANTRLTNPAHFTEIAKAVKGMITTDTGPDRLRAVREAMSVFAGIGKATGDKEGGETKTAAAGFASRLAHIYPEKDVTVQLDEDQQQLKLAQKKDSESKAKKLRDEGKIEQAQAELVKLNKIDEQLQGVKIHGTGLKTLNERIDRLRSDPIGQQKFLYGDPDTGLKTMSFRGPTKDVIRSMVSDPNSPSAKLLMESRQLIKVDDKAYQDKLEIARRGTPQLKLQETHQAGSAVIEDFKQHQTIAARRVEAEKLLWKTMAETRAGTGMMDWMGEHSEWMEGAGSFKKLVRDPILTPEKAAIVRLLQRRRDIVPDMVGAPTRSDHLDNWTDIWLNKALPNLASGKNQKLTQQLSEEDRTKVKLIDDSIRVLQRAESEAVEQPANTAPTAAAAPTIAAVPKLESPASTMATAKPSPMTLDDLGPSQPNVKKIQHAAVKSSNEAVNRLKSQLKKVERELAGGSSQLKKQPGRRESLQREAEQLRQQIAAAEEVRTAAKVTSRAGASPAAEEESPPVKVNATAGTPAAPVDWQLVKSADKRFKEMKRAENAAEQEDRRAAAKEEQQPLPAPAAAIRETQLPATPPSESTSALVDLTRQQLAELRGHTTAIQEMTSSQRLLMQRLGSTAARTDLQVATA